MSEREGDETTVGFLPRSLSLSPSFFFFFYDHCNLALGGVVGYSRWKEEKYQDRRC